MPGVRVDGGPHVGGGRLWLARFPHHYDHHTFAVGLWRHAHRLAENQPVVAGVVGLQIIGFSAVRLLVPFDQGAGAVVHDHPLQMRGHGDSSSRCSSQRRR